MTVKRLELEVIGDLSKVSVGQDVKISVGEKNVKCRILGVTEEGHREGKKDIIDRLLENPKDGRGFKPMTRDEIYER